MINIKVKKLNDIIERIDVSGHACYDEFGKDIVCAGISASLITSVNAILRFDENAIIFNESNNFFVENIKKDNITNVLLDNLYETMKEFEKKYNKYLKIKED